MSFFVFGINHTKASVSLREKVAFTPELLTTALVQIKTSQVFDACVILSTCNRTEIYAQISQTLQNDANSNISQVTQSELETSNLKTSETIFLDWLCDFHGLEKTSLTGFTYQYQNLSAIEHLLKVAIGLDSMILGEPQILGQLKTAFDLSTNAGLINKNFNLIFQQTFFWSKKIRTQTQIGKNPVSVAYACVNLAMRVFPQIAQSKILLIGAGDTISLVGQHLESSGGVKEMLVANRTLEKGAKLAANLKAQNIKLEEIPSYLSSVDIVITSTASPLPIIGKGMMERIVKERKFQPIYLIDLAMPRDIEAEVSEIYSVNLFTLDDLQNEISDNLAARKKSAYQAQVLIKKALLEIQAELRLLNAGKIINEFRLILKNIAKEQLLQGLNELENGKDAKMVLEAMTHRLTQSFLHYPTLKIREAAKNNREDYLAGLKYLLTQVDNLIPNTSTQKPKKKR